MWFQAFVFISMCFVCSSMVYCRATVCPAQHCLLTIKKNQWKTGYKNEGMLRRKFFFCENSIVILKKLHKMKTKMIEICICCTYSLWPVLLLPSFLCAHSSLLYPVMLLFFAHWFHHWQGGNEESHSYCCSSTRHFQNWLLNAWFHCWTQRVIIQSYNYVFLKKSSRIFCILAPLKYPKAICNNT